MSYNLKKLTSTELLYYISLGVKVASTSTGWSKSNTNVLNTLKNLQESYWTFSKITSLFSIAPCIY